MANRSLFHQRHDFSLYSIIPGQLMILFRAGSNIRNTKGEHFL